jgi:hypothetical protein
MPKVSNCCGAAMKGEWLDVEMCPDCKEHCSVEDTEEESETNLFIK